MEEKNVFYEKLDEYYKLKSKKKPFPKYVQLQMIAEIEMAKIKTGKKDRRQYYLLSTYDVLSVAEEKFLIHKQNAADEKIRYLVCYEDLFDKIKEFHIRTGHGGNVKLRNALHDTYYVPRPPIEIFLTVCETCNCKKPMNRKLVIKPITTADFNERAQIDLVDFQSVPDGKFKWILNYQDHATKFVILRPLESKRATEVANELLSILLTFGAPKILQSDNGREFVNSVINELKDLWPECVIVHGRPRHPQSQGSIERSNQDVEHMLRAWMADNKSKKWSVGLNFVQFQKNSSFHRTIGRSPYKALFGNDPKIGLSTSNLPSDLLKKLTTEEDLEHISQIKEIKKRSIACSICKVDVDLPLSEIAENNEIICQLCDSSKKIQIQRELGHEGQSIAAEKMIKGNNKKTDDFEINQCVVFGVPKVDRGPTDPPNIICVITEQKKKGLHKLGTKYGLLKGWFSSECLKKSTTQFLTTDQVDKNVEFSVREMIKKISGGQGFLSCSCKAKNPCQSSRCACFKNNMQCNSRCHNQSSCKNK